MANFMGWENYLTVAEESSWASAGSTYSYFPVESCSIRATAKRTTQTPLLGIRQRKNQRKKAYTVGGQIAAPWFGFKQNSKSLAEWLIEWALSAPAGNQLTSFTGEWGEAGTDNKRWVGLCVNQLTIAGDAESGVIKLTADVIGKSEAGGISLQTIPADMDELQDADFADVVFSIGATSGALSATDLKSFSIVIANNCVGDFVNSRTISSLTAGERNVTFSVVLNKTANTYDALRRTSGSSTFAGRLAIKALHGSGGGTPYRKCTFDLDRMNFEDADEQGTGMNELRKQNLSFIGLKQDSSVNELVTTWADSA